MPRKNNTRQRLFEAALGLPIEPTKAQRLAFIKEHNPDLKKSTAWRCEQHQ
jgi:hypothetical protein